MQNLIALLNHIFLYNIWIVITYQSELLKVKYLGVGQVLELSLVLIVDIFDFLTLQGV